LLNEERGRPTSCVFPVSAKQKYTGSEAKEFFAQELFFESVLGEHRAAFTRDQYREFKTLFASVLRGSGKKNDRSPADHDCAVALRASDTTDMFVDFNVVLIREDVELVISLHWRRLDDGWRIVDLQFDGASLAQDYRSQFARIIAAEGPDGLLEKLRAAPVLADDQG
jgi:ABC-type transporter MlaC component